MGWFEKEITFHSDKAPMEIVKILKSRTASIPAETLYGDEFVGEVLSRSFDFYPKSYSVKKPITAVRIRGEIFDKKSGADIHVKVTPFYGAFLTVAVEIVLLLGLIYAFLVPCISGLIYNGISLGYLLFLLIFICLIGLILLTPYWFSKNAEKSFERLKKLLT